MQPVGLSLQVGRVKTVTVTVHALAVFISQCPSKKTLICRFVDHTISRIMSGGWGEQVGEGMWNSPDEKTPEELDTLKVE